MKTLLIANRGEIAVRIIRTAKRMGYRTIAVFADCDEGARFCQDADAAYPLHGNLARDTYLNVQKIIEIAQETKTSLIHPGYGFLSEHAASAQAILDAGIGWVGPSPSVIRRVGEKDQAKIVALQANIPIIPSVVIETLGSTLKETLGSNFNIPGPWLIKAAGGGGGRGMRVVHNDAEMLEALCTARQEAERNFGNPKLLIEPYFQHARHIEVQIFGDRFGHVLHLGDRDCSIQRAYQKVIEEAPAFLPKDLQDRLRAAAVKMGQSVQYENAGTVEFLVVHDAFYFMEMNTRLQVEHPVTEAIFGIDLVEWQLLVAEGHHLPATTPEAHGHAFEARIYAEDPLNHFAPQSGLVEHFSMPDGLPGMRLDTGLLPTDRISPYFDAMLAKLICHGETRQEALERLQHSVHDLELYGIEHNQAFLEKMLAHPDVANLKLHTKWLDATLADFVQQLVPSESDIKTAIALSIALDTTYHPWQYDGFSPYVPQCGQIRVMCRGIPAEYAISELPHVAHLAHLPHFRGVRRYYIRLPTLMTIEPCPPLKHQLSQNPLLMHAPVTGTIVDICVGPGQHIEADEVLIRIEAMKMIYVLRAPRKTSILHILAQANTVVQEGQLLLEFQA